MTPAPAGWYPQPDGTQRWWDGYQWTAHQAPTVRPMPAASTPRASSAMRVAGAVVLAFGLMIAALLFTIPTTVSVLGTSGSCGMPLAVSMVPVEARVASEEELPIAEACRTQSIQRVVAGVGVGGVGLVAGVIMILSQHRRT